MKRWLPHPVMSAAVLVMWLLLEETLTPSAVLVGAILALLIPRTLAWLDVAPLRLHSFKAVFALIGMVAVDVIRSNIAVARVILFQRHRDHFSGFIHVPMHLRNPQGLALLAIILTCTPGTLWVQYDSGRGRLLLHVLDLVDEDVWIRLIKGRYERLLMEIFE